MCNVELLQAPERGWWRAAVEELLDRSGACPHVRAGRIHLEIVDAMGVNEREMGAGLAGGAVAALLLALQGHLQRAANADQVGRELGEQGGAVGQPLRLDQDMIDEDMV